MNRLSIELPGLSLKNPIIPASGCFGFGGGLLRFQHPFDEDTVAVGGVVHEDVGDGADDAAILDDGAAGHADVK